MRYIVSFLLVFSIYGCEKESSGVESASSLSNTSSLQPEIEDKESQPPSPPSLKEE